LKNLLKRIKPKRVINYQRNKRQKEMTMREEIKNELIEQQSILSQIDKSYFAPTSEVPNGYFEGMEDAFFAKLRANDQPKASQSISLWQKSKVSYSIAAVSIFAIIGFAMFNLFRTDNMNSLSQNEVESYLVEEEELTAVSDTNTKISTPSTVKLNELTNEEITNYLLENEDIDIQNIN
jgi:hypothetical protein